MFCKNCGTQLNDGDLFCVKCGKRVEMEVVAEPEVKAEAMANAAPTAEAAPAPEKAAEAAPAPEKAAEAAPAPKKAAKKASAKKGGKLWKILIPVGAVVGAAAVLIAVNFTKVSNFVTKTVLPADKYYSKVEEKEINELASAIADSYESSLKNNVDLTDMGMDAGITLELGKDAQDLVASYMGTDDAQWLEKVGLNLNVSMKDDMAGATIAALLGKDQLISAEALMDMDQAIVYLLVPELSEKYIGVDLEYTDAGYYFDSAGYDELAGLYDDFYEAMPDAKVLEELLNRYLLVAVNNIDNVKKSTDVLEVGDVEQKCTVLKVKLTQKDMLTIMEAILEEAKDDKDLMKVITNFAETLSYEYGVDPDEIEDAFEEGIEDLLDDLKDAKDYADSDSKLIMQVWINSDGEVVGRDVTFDTYELKYYMPQLGKDFAMEISFTDGYDTIEVIGEGKKTDSAMSGEFVVTASDMDLLEIVVEDYQYADVKNGNLKGKFTIKPTENLLDEADLGVPSSMISDFALVLEMNMSDESAEVSMSLDNDGDMFAKITVSAATGSGKIEAVSESDAIMYEDDYDLIEWLASIDFDGFLKKIEGTKLPTELITLIEDYCYDIEELVDYYYEY